MAIPSPYETQSPSLGIGSLPNDHPAFEQYRKLRAAQTASLEQHKQYAVQLNQQQQQVNMRAGDTDIAGRLLKILDPNVNKSARQFLMRELAQNVGVDPKNDNFKAVAAMIGGLDPNTMAGVKSVIFENLKNSSPGQVTQMAAGVLSGTMPIDTLMGEVSKVTRAQQLTAPMQGATAEDTSMSPTNGGGAGPQAGAPSAAPTSSGDVMSFKEKRTFQPQAERINPQLQAELGLDSKTELRNQDLLKNGYTIPLDSKQQAEVATELSLRTPNMHQTFRDVGNLTQAIRDTGASENYRTVSQRVVGMLSSRPGFQNSSGPGSEGWAAVEQLAQQKATALVKNGDPEAIRNTTNTLLNLSYMATLGGPMPGNKLTNGVLAQNINQVNSLSDMYAAASGALDAQLKEYDRYTRTNTGQSGMTILFNKTPDKLSLMSDLAQSSEVLSPEIRQQVIDIGEKIKSGQPLGPKIEPASPTLSEERSTLGGLEVTEEKGQIAEREQRMDLQRKADTRAESADKRAEERLDAASKREDRMAATAAQNQSLEREKFDWQKQKYEEQKGEQSKERIAKAFQHFGAAIAGSVKGIGSLGSSGSSGGGQDTGAFKLAPGPQRTPPRPGSYQVPDSLLYGVGKR